MTLLLHLWLCGVLHFCFWPSHHTQIKILELSNIAKIRKKANQTFIKTSPCIWSFKSGVFLFNAVSYSYAKLPSDDPKCCSQSSIEVYPEKSYFSKLCSTTIFLHGALEVSTVPSQRNKVPGSNPGRGLCGWSLQVLPMRTWVFSRYFPLLSKDMHVRFIVDPMVVLVV